MTYICRIGINLYRNYYYLINKIAENNRYIQTIINIGWIIIIITHNSRAPTQRFVVNQISKYIEYFFVTIP